MEKLNIAELLKNCPSGMELDCTIVDELYFGEVTEHMIKCYTKQYHESTCTCNTIYFHHDGTYLTTPNAKCVIFPKGKTTWEGFQRPFKDRDIIYTRCKNHNTFISIFKEISGEKILTYCDLCSSFYNGGNNVLFGINDIKEQRLATEEEKRELFDVIKAKGYRWNPEAKTLEKLIKPKFKVGDRITNGKVSITIGYIDDNYYYEVGRNIANMLFIKNQDDWKLVPNKFDITTLKPFDKVLVRTDNFTPAWTIAFYDGYNPNIGGSFTPFGVSNGKYFQQCIPYEGNEHLRGTTNECSEYYKTWK